ncbi:hemagglutinin/amebocyte aggregation factor-like [Engraulis encrasicolus]|uniref:hemagglutinin/amebocyte aggregation factor-like n=1 Tax=Engraulis encrasicolus TaxID=184585 RepID=UPI002FCF8C36
MKTLKTVCSLLLLLYVGGIMCKAVDSSSGEEDEGDLAEVERMIEDLAKRPTYEESKSFANEALDDLEVPALTNDTDGSSAKRSKRYVNSFNGYFYAICPSTQTISRISSYHSNTYEDRRFSFSCKSTFSSTPTCTGSGYVNSFNGVLSYTCPSNYVMSGVASYHSNTYQDRRFYIRCCRAPGHYHHSCRWTPWVNYYEEYFNWYVPNYNYLAGVYSIHHNSPQDRRFRFLYCAKY